MKIIIIHGNGLVSQLNKISALKKEFDPLSIVEFSGKSFSFSQAVIQFSTPQLFSEKRLVILEDFDSKTVDLENLPQDEELTVVIKFNKLLPASDQTLKKALALKLQVISFTEQDEASVFPFLDLLADKNSKALEQVNWRLEEHGSQYLFTMILYLLRKLVQKPKNNLPPFVLKKMDQQKKNFPLEKIKYLYKEVLETDFKIKSGLIEEKTAFTLLVNKVLTS